MAISFPVPGTKVNADGELVAYEGMLVTIPQDVPVATLFGFGRFGEIGLFGGSSDSSDGRLPIYTQISTPDDSGALIAACEDEAVGSTFFSGRRRDGATAQNLNVILREANGGTDGTTGDAVGQYDAGDGLRSGDTVTDLTA